MANKYMKRSSTLVIIRDIQTKTTVTYSLHLSQWLNKAKQEQPTHPPT